MKEITLTTVKEIQSKIENIDYQEKEYLEEFAQNLAQTIHETFDFSILTRVYINFPYEIIPQKNQEFVDNLAKSVEVFDKVNNQTPILSLMGTYGKLENWRSRHLSKGHVGIPLISTDFITNIPMMARLLSDLKVDIEGLNQQDKKITSDVFGKFQGMFFIDDAAVDEDEQGRKIIAAQDFVEEHNIKSVFGFGGQASMDGSYCVVVVFTDTELTNQKARLNLVLNNTIRKVIKPYFDNKKIFKPEISDAY